MVLAVPSHCPQRPPSTYWQPHSPTLWQESSPSLCYSLHDCALVPFAAGGDRGGDGMYGDGGVGDGDVVWPHHQYCILGCDSDLRSVEDYHHHPIDRGGHPKGPNILRGWRTGTACSWENPGVPSEVREDWTLWYSCDSYTLLIHHSNEACFPTPQATFGSSLTTLATPSAPSRLPYPWAPSRSSYPRAPSCLPYCPFL